MSTVVPQALWFLLGSPLRSTPLWHLLGPLGCPFPAPPDLCAPRQFSGDGGKQACLCAGPLIGGTEQAGISFGFLGSVGEGMFLSSPGPFRHRQCSWPPASHQGCGGVLPGCFLHSSWLQYSPGCDRKCWVTSGSGVSIQFYLFCLDASGCLFQLPGIF